MLIWFCVNLTLGENKMLIALISSRCMTKMDLQH